MNRKIRWLLPFAVLPLLGLPLIAQEPEQEQESAAPPAETAADAADLDEEDAAPLPLGPEERVSADNNLSFPVDI